MKLNDRLLNNFLRFLFSFFAIVSACLTFFWISIGDSLFRLSSTQLDMAGDGFKNYYTLAYQYKYGNGIQFDGFMYPYGDLATYADGQILIVWILQGLRSLGLDLEQYLLLIVNVLPLLSFVLAGLILVRIFMHYKIAYPFALLFSILCIALSPQIFRVQSHYALAYAYLIPAIWWFNIKIESGGKLVWIGVFLSCILVFIHGFIHPYLIFISSIFLLGLWLCKVIIKRQLVISVLLQGILPVICFLLLMNGIDVVEDRPKNPYGLLVHKTEVSDLLPFFGWFQNSFGDLLSLRQNYNEGYAYVGLLILIVPLLLLIKKGFKKLDEVQDEIIIGKSLLSYFIAGLLCLAFGMGLHIILTGGLILDLLPMIKQFRAMGRVSWVFYYTTFVFLAIILYQLFDSIESKVFKWSILSIVVGLYLMDVYDYHKSLNKIVTTYKSDDLLNTSKQIESLLTKNNIKPTKYQAIWVLPSSSEGTEKISFKDDWSSKMNAIPFSYQTGLPLTSIVMSRSSIANSLKIMQLSSSAYVEKEVLKDFDNDKPLLIIMQNDRLKMFEDIIELSSFIDKRSDFSLYEITIDSLKSFKRVDKKKIIFPNPLDSLDGLFLNFEGEKESGFLSEACKLINGSEEIFNHPLNLKDTLEYTLSLWYRILDDKSNVPNFQIQSFDENQKLIKDKHFRDWDMQRVEVVDDWIRLVQDYKFSPSEKNVKFIANGEYLHLDRVLFKRKSADFSVATNNPKFIQWNHLITQAEF